MPTLLVVARDDGFLPQGWVSAILSPGAAPSDYEKSGRLWKTLEVPDGALNKLSAASPASLGLRALIADTEKIIVHDSAEEILRARRSSRNGLKSLPGPGHLDRSSSTVWDYGPGRTYSTPQAAFDALLMQEGDQDFTETHYLRGWSGTYYQGPSTTVLAITTVCPSTRFPLVMDAGAGQSVIFDDEDGGACLGGIGVSHVRVHSLALRGAYAGVIPAPFSDSPQVEDWSIVDCDFDGSQRGLYIGVSLYKTDFLRVIRSRFHQLGSHAVGTIPGYPPNVAVLAEVRGCRLDYLDYGLFNNAEFSCLLVNNTIRGNLMGLRHDGDQPLILAGMINNVFTAASDDFSCLCAPELTPALIKILRSDANCFHPGSRGQMAQLTGINLDLAGWQEHFGQDEHSLAEDPLLSPELSPLPGSPCLRAGVCWDNEDAAGVLRAASVDIGAVQTSPARVPAIIARGGPAEFLGVIKKKTI
jgi:hypothetical protein